MENIYSGKYVQSPTLCIFQTENPCSLKYGLDVIPYRASQLWQQVPIDIREAASLALFKNYIKTWEAYIAYINVL